ncbi:MAG: Fic family protein [Sphaerotilus natans]
MSTAAHDLDPDRLVEALRSLNAPASSSQLAARTGASLAQVKRRLGALVAAGVVARAGQARSTRYALVRTLPPTDTVASVSLSLRERLNQPLAMREPVTYRREFLEGYVPNETRLLPEPLALELAHAARMAGQQPAGTYARQVLEPLLIDLSWSSSRLEGNRYSLLATEELFRRGTTPGDADAVMLLNHKRAIEFLVDAVPEYGLTSALLRNLHALLLQDLLADADSLGTIRRKVVQISDTVYVPTQVPLLLEEMFDLMLDKARRIKNPVEAAFFLWVHLAYLQPFEDGNKRTSRLAANVPLMLYNCAPLSFNEVAPLDYAQAMVGVYEFQDVSLAVELFAATYRRSLKKYTVLRQSMGAPDPMRLRYRETLNDVIQLIVRDRRPMVEALAVSGLGEDTAPGFRALLEEELRKLAAHNCARYRLTLRATEAWIQAGRPL